MLNKLNKIIFIILFIVLFIGILYVFLTNFSAKELSITYPHNETLFPPDIASPTFYWDDKTDANNWILRIEFQGTNEPLEFQTVSMDWTPKRDIWELIKKRSLEKTAKLTILGFKKILGVKKIQSKKTISIKTSRDEVGAPIFFRDVPLPFEYAANNMEEIKWRLGDISSDKPPRVILEDMLMCGNCHSFSGDGTVMGMDVDYANDKGSYVITGVSEEIMLNKEKIITWSDYKREDQEPTFGLLSQISPDGKYAVGTVKDRSVFVPVDDLYYSQLFFPFKGILAYYSVATNTFQALPGADDKRFVQSNPAWSPDGKYIVFARNWADTLKIVGKQVILSQDQCYEYLEGRKKFPFNLYRIPFNDGKGGKAEPLEGASNNGMSNYFAKYSPDGRWIVFCMAESFMLLQPDSKLYIISAEGGQAREMKCNSNQMNSWHSWSPNGKWLVFSSKANTPYTQLFLTHIDEEGNDSPPVVLSNFTSPDRAANIPEFINIKPDGIKQIHQSFMDYYSYLRKANELSKFEKYAEAERLFRKSIELNPNHAITHHDLGSLLAFKNRVDEAEKEYEIALKLGLEDTDALHNIGRFYLEKNDYDKAQKSFETALKYDSDYAPAFEGMGILLYKKGDYEKAKEKLITALNIDSELTNASFNLGKLYMLNKEYDKAEKAFETVVKKEFDSEAYIRLGTIHFIREEYDKAEKEFKAVLKINPENARALHNLGLIYMNMKQFDKAEKDFRTVYMMSPNDPYICFILGNVLSMNKRTIPEAISMYNKSLSLMPSNTQGYIDLGNLYLKIGRKEQAINEFEKALKLNPDAQELKEQIDKLKKQ